MPKRPEDLFAFLDEIGIPVATVWHQPLFTVAQSQAIRGEIEGAHTKNLFLRDRRERHFLITVGEDSVVDLKSVHLAIGASGRVSFGKPEALMQLLGVSAGAVTAFGIINDTQGLVSLVLDEALMRNETVNCHPLTNEATTSIRSIDLIRFARATGHEPAVLNVTAR